MAGAPDHRDGSTAESPICGENCSCADSGEADGRRTVASPNHGQSSLADKLAFYDDAFPRDLPTWDEDAIVTPRAFLCEYGYDVPGRRVPERFGEYLLDEHSLSRDLAVVRAFSSFQRFQERAVDDVTSLLERDAYTAVELFHLAGEDDHAFAGYPAGGYLVRYSYSREEGHLDDTGHDRFGYYVLPPAGVSELVTKLLCDGNSGPWSPDSADTRGSRGRRISGPEWKQLPNPAAAETWVVVDLDDRHLQKRVVERSAEALLADGVYPQQTAADTSSSAETADDDHGQPATS